MSTEPEIGEAIHRRFLLLRQDPDTNSSPHNTIAEGVMFSNGQAALMVNQLMTHDHYIMIHHTMSSLLRRFPPSTYLQWLEEDSES